MLANANVQPISTPGLRWFGRLLTVAFLVAVVVLVFGRYVAFGRQELGSLFRRWGRDAYVAKRYDASVRNYNIASLIGGNRDTRALFSRGLAYQKANDHRAAVADFNRLLQISPTDSRALIAKARSNKVLGNRAEIIRDFEAAAVANPSSAAAFVGLARARADAGDFKGAVAELTKAVDAEPTNARAIGLRAQYRLKIDDGNGAFEDADRYLQIEPNSRDGFALRSLAHTKLAQYDQALVDADQAIQIGPETATLIGRRATLFQKTGKVEESLPEYQRALALNDTLYWAYRGRGVSHWIKQNISAAEADFSKSVELAPEDFTGRLRRARYYVEVNKPEQAIVDADKAIKLQPRSARAYITRASAYARLKDQKRLMADLARAGALETENLRTKYERARVYVYTDQYDAAIRDADAILTAKPDDVGALKVRGKSYYKLGKYEQALTDYNALVRLQPSDPFAWLLRGKTNGQLQNLREATSDFDRSVELGPKNAPSYIERAISLARQGETDAALKDLDTAQNLGSLDPRLFVARGNVAYVRRQYPLAIENATAAVAQRPEMLPALMLRARAQSKAGSYEPALKDADAAVALRPEDPGALRLRAKIHAERQNYDKALSDLKLALVRRPDDVKSLVDRSKIYVKLRRPGSALQDLSAALRRQPENVDALVARGYLFANQDRTNEALADLNGALERAPERVDALRLRGRVFRRSGELMDALADLKAADSLEPKNLDTLIELVRVHEKMRNYQEAVRVASQIVELKGDTKLLRIRGDAYLRLKDYPKAQADFEKVVAKDPKDIRALKGLASSLTNQEKHDAALKIYDQWLTLDGQAIEAKYQRSMTYYRMGQYDKALADIREVADARGGDANVLRRYATILRKNGDTCAAIQSFDRAMLIDTSLRGNPFAGWIIIKKDRLAGRGCKNELFDKTAIAAEKAKASAKKAAAAKPRAVKRAVVKAVPVYQTMTAIPTAGDLGKLYSVTGVVLSSEPVRTGIRLVVQPLGVTGGVPVVIPLTDYNRIIGTQSAAVGSTISVQGKLTLNTSRREVQLRVESSNPGGNAPSARSVNDYQLGRLTGNDHNALVRVRGSVVAVGRVGVTDQKENGKESKPYSVYQIILQDATGTQKIYLDTAAGILLEQAGALQSGSQIEVVGRIQATDGQGIVIRVAVPSDIRRL